MVAATADQGRLDQSPLFRAALIYENFSLAAREAAGARFEPLTLAPDASVPGTAKFDLSLLVAQSQRGGMDAALEYRTALFDPACIARMAGTWNSSYSGFSTTRSTPSAPSRCSPTRKKNVLLSAPTSSNPSSYPRDSTVHALLEAQANRNGDRVAVRFRAEDLTYRALQDRAHGVALSLQAQGVSPGDRVAVCVRRSIDMVVALLGVLKAGAAYVPIDPQFPAARRRHILTDSQASAVIGHAETAQLLPNLELPIL